VAAHTLFATCTPGLEPVLLDEVRRLGVGGVEQQVGGVHFRGELADAWRANLLLRSAVRVLLRLERFEARDGDDLYRAVAERDWRPYLRPGGRLWVQVQARESALDHSRYAAQRVKDAIVDQLRAPDGTRPTVEREGADLRVHLHLWRERATLSLDTSGESLHKRGWRRAQGRAPCPENLAAALVLASGWDGRAPLIDPFCGSGTVLVEAAWIAAGRAPGSLRARFGFETWPCHAAAAYARVREQALAALRPRGKPRLVGSDRDPARVAEARANARAAEVDAQIELAVADALDLAPRAGWNAWIVSNLPFGERVGRASDLLALHVELGRILRARCAGYRATLLVGDARLADALALPEHARRTVLHGGSERVLVDARP